MEVFEPKNFQDQPIEGEQEKIEEEAKYASTLKRF